MSGAEPGTAARPELTVVLRVPCALLPVVEDSLLSVAAQTVLPDRVLIIPEGLAGDDAAQLPDLLDAFRPLLPEVPMRLVNGESFAGALLRFASERGGFASVLRSGDALFGNWVETVRLALAGAPATGLVRMRFVRQPARLERGVSGLAPYATAGPVRPYADRYDPARHRIHMQTPSSAVAWPTRAAQGLRVSDPDDPRDIVWRVLERAASAGRISERPEITSLVRAWSEGEWRAFERDALEPGAALAAPSRTRRARERLRRFLGR